MCYSGQCRFEYSDGDCMIRNAVAFREKYGEVACDVGGFTGEEEDYDYIEKNKDRLDEIYNQWREDNECNSLKVIKSNLNDEHLADFLSNIMRIFGCDEKPTYYDLAYTEGTVGWYNALEDMCEKYELNDLFEYYNDLAWYDSDIFDGKLCDMLLERGLIE